MLHSAHPVPSWSLQTPHVLRKTELKNIIYSIFKAKMHFGYMSARSDLWPNRTCCRLLICSCRILDTFQEPVVASQSRKLFFSRYRHLRPFSTGNNEAAFMIREDNRAQLARGAERSGAEDHPDLFRWNMKLTFPGFCFRTAVQICERKTFNNCTFGQI